MLAVLFTIFAATASLVSANVTLDNPLDAQFPLIARIDQNFTWTMSSRTFSTDLDKSLNYYASVLPVWLSFDGPTLTLFGMPSADDEGQAPVTVTASDGESTNSSTFILCVTSYPAPSVQIPISQQFYPNNPALSSLFFLAPGSALAMDVPTLRVPARWSFSIGLDGNTCTAENDLHYAALRSDRTPLPSWIQFNSSTITFDGIAPDDALVATPLTLPVEVYCADQQGYSADSLLFDLVVATHELSADSTMPTINITAGTPFNVSMSSPADFTGVLVDGQPVQPANVSSLSVEVSWYNDWLAYDPKSRALSGSPPSNLATTTGELKPMLPVTLTSNFNQTLYTSVSLDVVPSYFSASDLGTIQADPGQTVQFNLTKYFANASDIQQHLDANLSVSFSPSSAGAYLAFDPVAAQLTGQIPSNSNVSEISVTFIAYSRVTHSTSHATLMLVSPALERVKGGSGADGTGTPSTKEVTLIVSLVFGILGGIFLIGIALALFRRHARVKDNAVVGEEGAYAWTEKEKRWYWIEVDQRDDQKTAERGYGWNDHAYSANMSAQSEKGSLETQPKEGHLSSLADPPNALSYEQLGLGLRRVSPHTGQATPSTVQASCADGMMKKADFLGRIRNTARNVSDMYKRRSPPVRPLISRPVPLIRRDSREVTPIEGQYVEIVKSMSSSQLHGMSSMRDDHHREASTLTTSPSNSTGDQSIPRRRADFAPPNSPRGPRAPTSAAVKEIAQRSVVRTSLQSMDSHSDSLRPGGEAERPRLKQFTHASRVPPPVPSNNDMTVLDAPSGTRRIASQTAQVYKENHEGGRHTSIDELRIGMHYVRTLGEGSSKNVRSASDKSFSSLESAPSPHQQTTVTRGAKATASARFLARAGDKFKFRVPMPTLNSSSPYHRLEVGLMSGQALPAFMHVELKGVDGEKRSIEFYGVPSESDVGELQVGVFNVEGGECLVRVVVEVVGRGMKKT